MLKQIMLSKNTIPAIALVASLLLPVPSVLFNTHATSVDSLSGFSGQLGIKGKDSINLNKATVPKPESDSVRTVARKFADRGSQEISGAMEMMYEYSKGNTQYEFAISPMYRYFPIKILFVGPVLGVQSINGSNLFSYGMISGCAFNRDKYILYFDAGYERITGTTITAAQSGTIPEGYAIPLEAGFKFPMGGHFSFNTQVIYSYVCLSESSGQFSYWNGNLLAFGLGFSVLLY